MRTLLGLALAFLAVNAAAHPLAPALLSLEESASGQVEVSWKLSAAQVPGVRPHPVLPAHCNALGEPRAELAQGGLRLRWTLDCGSRGLVGGRIAISDLGDARIAALVRIELADGRQLRRLLNADAPSLLILEREAPSEVLRTYLELGFTHILGGLDHLLFVLGLVLLVHGGRALLLLVSGFTLGHSLTLALSVLGMIRAPGGAIEVLIAVSLLLVALELTREEGGGRSWLRRLPGPAALGFGLLHGLGFAGTLAEIGIPSHEVPLALLSFNLGIEAGQLLFVAAALLVRAGLHRAFPEPPRWALRLPAYALGSLAAFWCFERFAGLIS